jgi:mannose-6-phosphate isomerase
MWHILRAGRESAIALGFEGEYEVAIVRAACQDGTVEAMLHYERARAGDTFFTPARTVHAIGAGLALCEIQQHSDTTYRLYDYGRPRELHLEDGLAVADLGRWRARAADTSAPAPWKRLADCAYFLTDAAMLHEPLQHKAVVEGFVAFILLEGEGTMAGLACRAGQVWLAPAGTPGFAIEPRGALRLLKTSPPRSG